MKTSQRSRRRGSALLVAVVAITVAAVVTAAITWQSVAGRRLVESRQHQLQAEWLARAGIELAADRLLSDPAGYRGESVELVPGGRVRIEVRAEPGKADVFRVSSEALFPQDGRDRALRTVTRSFRRTTRDKQVRLEVIPEPGV
jgi:hypothetical protein